MDKEHLREGRGPSRKGKGYPRERTELICERSQHNEERTMDARDILEDTEEDKEHLRKDIGPRERTKDT